MSDEIPFNFEEYPPGCFEMQVEVSGGAEPECTDHDEIGGFVAHFPLKRREAEELMFQMADVLGWKVGT